MRWKRVFHSKRLTIKFPENKTVIPTEKCDSPLKMQRARRQTEFNSSTARASLLLIIVRSPRCAVHSARCTHISIYTRGKSNENQLRGVWFITVTIKYTAG